MSGFTLEPWGILCRYPYVFLNNGHFSDEFKAATSSVTAAATMYGEIPREHWSYPAWVLKDKAAAARRTMKRNGVLYGGCVPPCMACRPCNIPPHLSMW